MNGPIFVVVILVALCALLVAAAPQISQTLVRLKARKLPLELALRMEEEWLAELRTLTNRAGKLSFAVALMLTRRRAFVGLDQDSNMLHDRRVSIFAGRKSLVIISTAVFALAAFALSFFLPVRYASDAVFLIKPTEVPASLVNDLGNVSYTDRLKMLKDMMRSRTNLMRLANEFKLDENRPGAKKMDELVQQIQGNIEITTRPPETGEDLITLRYVGSDPIVAQNIAARLIAVVIQQDNEARERRIDGTVDFLSGQLGILVVRMQGQNAMLSRVRRTQGLDSAAPLVLEHEMLQTTYRTLFAKLEDAKMSQALTDHQKAGAFILIDPPRLGLPVGPNRLSITGIGALIGVGLGGIAVVGLKRKRPRVLA